MNRSALSAMTIVLGAAITAFSNPNLQVGIWTAITPAGASSSTSGFLPLAIDPNNPSVMYAGQCGNGMWKTTDGGSNWSKLGDASQMGTNYATTSSYIDNPTCIAIDPQNSQHLYTCDAAWCGSGQTYGFWESTNGGRNWNMPVGFQNAAAQTGLSRDAGRFDVDPADFKHILISFRYTPVDQAPFIESRDGGVTFVQHVYPTTMPTNTKGLNILHNPANGLGNGDTWLISSEQAGFWLTTNAGTSWTNVAPTATGLHGGANEIYYTKTGMLYIGGYPNPYRSSDNGKTWQAITNKMYGYYTAICGDGTTLYTMPSGSNISIVTSPESDGLTWTNQPNQNHSYGMLRYDSVNHIMYGCDDGAGGGIWALKVSATTVAGQAPAISKRGGSLSKSAVSVTRRGVLVIGSHSSTNGADVLYNVKGVRVWAQQW